MAKYALINVSSKGLEKPLSKLVETIAPFVGGISKLALTVPQAYADAKALKVIAAGEADVLDITQRADFRREQEAIIHQANLEAIFSKAPLQLPDRVSEKPVDSDWMLLFLDHAKKVSDDEMRGLWAKILAGEVTEPGRYAKRTLSFLSTLSREEAELFTTVSSLAFRDGRGTPVLLHGAAHDYFTDVLRLGIEGIVHLQSIGLVQEQEMVVNQDKLKGEMIWYFQQGFRITYTPKARKVGISTQVFQIPLVVGWKGFTSVGRELFDIAGGTPRPDFIPIVRKALLDVDVVLDEVANQEQATTIKD